VSDLERHDRGYRGSETAVPDAPQERALAQESNGQAAVSYVARGYGVFPVHGRTKRPLFASGAHPRWAPERDGPAGHKLAAWHPDDVFAWWPRTPIAAPGLVPPPGVAFIDADEKKRPGVVAWLRERWPEIFQNGCHRTRHVGAHIPVRVPAGVDLRQSVDPDLGIDTRAALKGYIVAPPAPGYHVEIPFRHVDLLIDLPAELVDILQPPRDAAVAALRPSAPPAGDIRLRRYVWSAIQGEHDRVASTGEGARNSTLHKAAVRLGSLVGAGVLTEEDARDALMAGVNAAAEPLAHWEAERTIASGIAYGRRHPRDLQQGSS
jgi:hypothetical protein